MTLPAVSPPGFPRLLSPLVGRDRETADVRALLETGDARLLTLTGPGGVGKTRLALRVGAEAGGAFADGVVLVLLAELRDPGLLLPAIAAAFDLRDEGAVPLAERLPAFLAARRALILLDNMEHLGDEGAAVVSALLAACPAIRFLVTSRVPLRLSGEQEYAVPPLALPDPGRPLDPATAAGFDGVALFLQRARAVRADFALTDREHGRDRRHLPAPGRVAAGDRAGRRPGQGALPRRAPGPPGQPPPGADRRSGATPRLASARCADAIAWSHDLLPPEEQALFRRLSVFVGGCTLEAAEWVMGDGSWVMEGGSGADLSPIPHDPSPSVFDGLASLVDKSLLRLREDADEPRFAMLETIREYGRARLAECGEERAVRDRHAAWCLAHAAEHGAKLNRRGQAEGMRRLQTEMSNLREALAWQERTGDGAGLLTLVGYLWFFWFARNLHEGADWMERALALGGPGAPSAARAQALNGLATIAHYLDADDRAVPAADEALGRWRDLDDPGGAATSLLIRGYIEEDRGNYARALDVLDQALAFCREAERRGGSPALEPPGLTAGTITAWVQYHLGVVHWGLGAIDRAQAAWREALPRFAAEEHAWGLSTTAGYLGLLAAITGDLGEAAAFHRRSLDLRWTLGTSEDLAGCFSDVAHLAAATGDQPLAARLFGAVAAVRDVAGGTWRLPERAVYEATQAAVRRTLGEGAFATAFAAGRTLSVEEAVAMASAAIDAAGGTGPFAAATPPAATSREPEDSARLSPREVEVLRLVVAGQSTREIAATLSISPRTVGTHVASILAKLGVDSRAGAVAYAFRHGITES